MIHKVTLTTQLVVPVIWGHVPVFPTSQLAQGGHFCALIRLLRVKKGFIVLTRGSYGH